ncbi:MAG TPA: radical SAM protein [Clostridiaceae bacterium]|jgi:histone acetyltransferase (RNA polymerase elongator complex component)|nr:radical SAM protein [Clostridiaceae bacterium]
MRRTRHINIPIFIPHMGCPHACVFCNQKKISGTLSFQSPMRVKKILEESFSTTGENDDVEIAFFGGSFTGIPEHEMITYLELAQPYLKAGKASGIRLSTRPDTITPHILKILKSYGVTAIELGVQSLDPEVLLQSQRGHSVEDVISACSLIHQSGIKLGIQTMLGLPDDTYEKALKTAKDVIKLKPHMIRIYPALVLKSTLLEEYYLTGQYTPLSLEEAIEWCTGILPLYREAKIKVLRMGLQDSDTLESSVVAGPYHPAFGELVESRILYKRITKWLDMHLNNQKRIIIRTRPRLLSKLVGQKRTNIKGIKEKYQLHDVVVKTDLEDGEFVIEVE